MTPNEPEGGFQGKAEFGTDIAYNIAMIARATEKRKAEMKKDSRHGATEIMPTTGNTGFAVPSLPPPPLTRAGVHPPFLMAG